MSEVTITIVIKTAGDVVATATSDQAGMGGPQPQFVPGGAATGAGGAPAPAMSPVGAGMAPAAPAPTLSIAGGPVGQGPTPAAPESLQQAGGAPTDEPPAPEELSQPASEGPQRGGRRRSSS
jgi:hypothetical protein